MTYIRKGDPSKLEMFLKKRVPAALIAADNGDLNPLKALHIATETPIYKYLGYYVAFHAYMRRFWVKTRDYGIIEIYSLDKADVRKEFDKYGILEIFEISPVVNTDKEGLKK